MSLIKLKGMALTHSEHAYDMFTCIRLSYEHAYFSICNQRTYRESTDFLHIYHSICVNFQLTNIHNAFPSYPLGQLSEILLSNKDISLNGHLWLTIILICFMYFIKILIEFQQY